MPDDTSGVPAGGTQSPTGPQATLAPEDALHTTDIKPDAIGRTKRPWYRRPWRPLLRRTHRWVSLTAIILVTAFFVSGVFQMYALDLVHWTHPSWFRSTPSSHPVSPARAVAIVQSHNPKFTAFDLWLSHGVYQVSLVNGDASIVNEAYVNPGTGAINAIVSQDESKMPLGSVGGFMANLHNCALSCKGMPGYVPFMAGTVPGLGWLWKTTAFVAASLAVIYLLISGFVLWLPPLRRWKSSFRLRRKNFYVFNVDLHRTVGFLAIPFLLMWALTGITLALPQSTTDLWYSSTGTKDKSADLVPNALALYGKAQTGTKVTLAQATARALAAIPGSKVAGVTLPDAAGKIWGQPGYFYWFNLVDRGLDPVRYSGTGSTFVIVGLYDGHTLGPAKAPSDRIWNDYRLGLHFGYVLNSWWRLLLLFFGLSPLILGFTGIVVWWRRRMKRRRGGSSATGPAPA